MMNPAILMPSISGPSLLNPPIPIAPSLERVSDDVPKECDLVLFGTDEVRYLEKEDSLRFKDILRRNCPCTLTGQLTKCPIKTGKRFDIHKWFDNHAKNMPNHGYKAKYPCDSCNQANYRHYHESYTQRSVAILRTTKEDATKKNKIRVRINPSVLEKVPQEVPEETDMAVFHQNKIQYLCKSEAYCFKLTCRQLCPCQGGLGKCPIKVRKQDSIHIWYDQHAKVMLDWPYKSRYPCDSDSVGYRHYHTTQKGRVVCIYRSLKRSECKPVVLKL